MASVGFWIDGVAEQAVSNKTLTSLRTNANVRGMGQYYFFVFGY